MDDSDRDMDRLVQLLDYCPLAPVVTIFVPSSASYPEDRKFKALSAFNTIRDAAYGNGLDTYIDKLIVGGFAGDSIQFGLLQGQPGNYGVTLGEFLAAAGHHQGPAAPHEQPRGLRLRPPGVQGPGRPLPGRAEGALGRGPHRRPRRVPDLLAHHAAPVHAGPRLFIFLQRFFIEGIASTGV